MGDECMMNQQAGGGNGNRSSSGHGQQRQGCVFATEPLCLPLGTCHEGAKQDSVARLKGGGQAAAGQQACAAQLCALLLHCCQRQRITPAAGRLPAPPQPCDAYITCLENL
jgi:hypothetical protein